METASLYIQKMGVVLLDTMSKAIVSDGRRVPRGGAKDVS